MGFGGQDGGYATFVFNKYGKELAQKYTSRLSNKDDILCAKAIRAMIHLPMLPDFLTA